MEGTCKWNDIFSKLFNPHLKIESRYPYKMNYIFNIYDLLFEMYHRILFFKLLYYKVKMIGGRGKIILIVQSLFKN